MRLVTPKAPTDETERIEGQLDVAAIYSEHAQFLYKSLHRMGVPQADLPDAMQEVLCVVHRRLGSFDGQSRLTTWLFGICLRVASTLRRGQRRRREEPLALQPEQVAPVESSHPERQALVNDARRRLNCALEALDPEKRAVLVMFELEGMGCAEIATLLGVPKGTVFSRLSHARQAFLEQLSRLEKREGKAWLNAGVRR